MRLVAFAFACLAAPVAAAIPPNQDAICYSVADEAWSYGSALLRQPAPFAIFLGEYGRKVWAKLVAGRNGINRPEMKFVAVFGVGHGFVIARPYDNAGCAAYVSATTTADWFQGILDTTSTGPAARPEDGHRGRGTRGEPDNGR